MPSLNLVSARLVDSAPTGALCEYIVAGNGLFVRAEDDRMEACLPVATAVCPGLPLLQPYARLRVPLIPAAYLTAVYQSAFRHLPNEAAFQFIPDGPLPWRCVCPPQCSTPGSVDYDDEPEAVVDVHSHGLLPAFWSSTDDRDEGGLRFYVVAGRIGEAQPTLLCRAGIYGHRWPVPATFIFDGLGPFTDMYNQDLEIEP